MDSDEDILEMTMADEEKTSHVIRSTNTTSNNNNKPTLVIEDSFAPEAFTKTKTTTTNSAAAAASSSSPSLLSVATATRHRSESRSEALQLILEDSFVPVQSTIATTPNSKGDNNTQHTFTNTTHSSDGAPLAKEDTAIMLNNNHFDDDDNIITTKTKPVPLKGTIDLDDDDFDWSPKTPPNQPTIKIDDSIAISSSFAPTTKQTSSPKGVVVQMINNSSQTPPPKENLISGEKVGEGDSSSEKKKQQQEQEQQNNNINSSRPMTWSARKAKVKMEGKNALFSQSAVTPNNINMNNNQTPSKHLDVNNNTNNASSSSSPVSLALFSSFRSSINMNNTNNSNNGNGKTTQNLNSSLLSAEEQHLQMALDLISAAEEYRRLSLESRQNEQRNELCVAFVNLSITLQRQMRPDALAPPMAKWFRKWARQSDNLLARKLQEANGFITETMSKLQQQIQNQVQMQQQQLYLQQQQQKGGGGHKRTDSNGSSNFQLPPTSPNINHLHPHSHSHVGAASSYGSSASLNRLASPSLSASTPSGSHLQMMSNLELTVTRERKGSSPPLSYDGDPHHHQRQQQLQLQNIKFVNIPGLQKSVIQFSRNYSPINAPPSAGQVRAEGILNDMQHWGVGDFGSMSYLAAPLVLVIGPVAAGKSSVIHCLTNKKPFFTTAPKVFPTLGIDAMVTKIEDVRLTQNAKVTLTTEMSENSQGHFFGQDQSAVSPNSNTSFSLAGGNSRTSSLSESNIATRINRATPTGKESEQQQVISLKSSAHLRFIEVPAAMLSNLPPKMLPLSGFELVFCFDVTLDGTKARRELAAQFRQITSSVMAGVQIRGEVPQPVLIPVYLVATHVDKMRNAEKNDGALAGLLRDLRLWFKFVQEATVGSASASSSPKQQEQKQQQQKTTTSETNTSSSSSSKIGGSGAFQFVQFYLVDVFAVSCADWTVVGERPRSASNFHEMASDMFRTISVLRPLTPVHVGAQVIEQFIGALESYEESTGTEVENLDGIRLAFSIRSDCNFHVANEIACRTLLHSSSSNSNSNNNSNNNNNNSTPSSSASSLPVPVRRVLIGLITFCTGIGRWVDSCGYFIDYALFLRLVLQHVSIPKILEDVGISSSNPTYDLMLRVFSRCLQYAFVDVLSYHGIVHVDEEEGLSSVLVGPQVFTRVVNCFYALQPVCNSAKQLNITEKAAVHFNENKHSNEFPEIGKTDREFSSLSSDSFGEDQQQNQEQQQRLLQLRQLHEDVMKDHTAWQFGIITPFAWRALFRGGQLASNISSNDDDFFVWCSRIVDPLGWLEPFWNQGHIDFVVAPSSNHHHHGKNTSSSTAVTSNSNLNSAASSNKNDTPILLSTMFAKPVDPRTQQFLLASLTVADDAQQPFAASGSFSGCPVSGTLTQAVLIELLHSASLNDNFTMRDIAVWNNCLCFSTYYTNPSTANHPNTSNVLHTPRETTTTTTTTNSSSTSWDYCCMMMIYWELESSSSPTCRCVVSGVSVSGGGSSSLSANVSPTNATTRTSSSEQGEVVNSLPGSPKLNANDLLATANQDNNEEEDEEDYRIVDVSSSPKALDWLKFVVERTIKRRNPIPELRPQILYRDSRLGSVTPVPFSGAAQTAREILAGCSRGAAERLIGDLQQLHERTWSDRLPLRSILETLMREERVGPHYNHQ